MRQEAQARRRAGFEVPYLDRGEVQRLYGIKGSRRAARTWRSGGRSAQARIGILRRAVARKARLHAPVEATGIEPLTSGAVVHTAAGPPLRASAVVFATGYEMPKGVPRKGHRVTSTWAFATRPQPRAAWRDEVMISEASDPYLYLRVGPQGRILCGGEDEGFVDEEKRDALIPQKIAALQEKLVRLLPRVHPEADYARRQLRRLAHRIAVDRGRARHEELLRRARLRRERHHLLDAVGAGPVGSDRRP